MSSPLNAGSLRMFMGASALTRALRGLACVWDEVEKKAAAAAATRQSADRRGCEVEDGEEAPDATSAVWPAPAWNVEEEADTALQLQHALTAALLEEASINVIEIGRAHV